MAKILFFNPPSRENIYLSTNTSIAAPSYPSLTLATLAGNLEIAHHKVKVIDLDLFRNYYKALADMIRLYKPDIVASTVNTPSYVTVRELMLEVKNIYPQIKTIVGGVHITALPEITSNEKCFDILVMGEGDSAINEIASASDLKGIPGIIYRDVSSGEKIINPRRELLKDLNALPFPAWQLFSLDKYKNSRLSARKNPVGLLETSRGCAFQCNFCNKLTFGSEHRVKEPKRVVDEMEYMLKIGFREIHIIDDSFSQDICRAKEVCAEIIKRNLKFTWSLFSGVRVDKVDFNFFKLAKQAGCWQVAFGIETGDQIILDNINKKTTLSQIADAVKLAKKAGINTFGFFILALKGETEATMRRTIDFAKSLPLDIAKFDICVPYPGTPYYNELKKEGRIISQDWSKYSCHQANEPLFNHPNIAWDVIEKYYRKAFVEFYLRPRYIIKRFIRSLRMGDLPYDIQYFLRAKW